MLIIGLLVFFTGKKDKQTVDNISGEELAKMYCASCHLQTLPHELSRDKWANEVLPQMGYRMGIYQDTSRVELLELGKGGQRVAQSKIYPTKATISNEQWSALKKYYLDNADSNGIHLQDTVKIKTNLTLFKIRKPEARFFTPSITALHFDDKRSEYYIADYKSDYSTLNIFDAELKSKSTLAIPSPVSDIVINSDTIFLTTMGKFYPSDAAAGSLIKVFKKKDSKNHDAMTTLIKDLQRPIGANYVDLDQDGDHDILIKEYGHHLGALNWYEKDNDTFIKHILSAKPGAIHTEIEDMNGDGLVDIVVLMAQGDEGIDIHYNKGNGNFTTERVLRFSPLYGSMHFQLYDFNNDGFKDIFYTNGDNADYSIELKPYHGIRIFINDGQNQFKEAYFFPLHGAYKSILNDFDHDGDVDIASISFFPDLTKKTETGFVFLENKSTSSKFEFDASTFADTQIGRWMTMKIADVDDDRDQDIILGSFTMLNTFGDTLNKRQQWIDLAVPFIVLFNQSYNKN